MYDNYQQRSIRNGSPQRRSTAEEVGATGIHAANADVGEAWWPPKGERQGDEEAG